MKFSAVILAGGKSSRMGRDKTLLEVDGQSLLARQIEVVRAAGASEVFISGRRGMDYTAFDCPVLQDRFPNSGPLGGIQTGLSAASTQHVLVLAVDMPRISTNILGQLARHCTDTAGAIPRVNGAIEPLAAFYPRIAVSLANELLEADRSTPDSPPTNPATRSCKSSATIALLAGRSGALREERSTKAPSAKHFAECSVAARLATLVDIPRLDANLFTNWNSPADLAKQPLLLPRHV